MAKAFEKQMDIAERKTIPAIKNAITKLNIKKQYNRLLQ